MLYTADIIGLVENHELQPYPYADDTQILGVCHPGGSMAYAVAYQSASMKFHCGFGQTGCSSIVQKPRFIVVLLL
jgi:hypothetical protein